jgi:hypothetical protein
MRIRGQVIAGFLLVVLVLVPLRARAEVVEPLAPPGRPASAVGSLIYVTSPGHLAQITQEDSLLHPRAVALANRANLGAGVLIGSAALGALIVAGAATLFKKTECTTPAVPPGFDLPVTPICQSNVNMPLAAAGMFTMVIGGSAGLLIAPSQLDWYGIINEWNTRHPDRTLLVPPGRSRR